MNPIPSPSNAPSRRAVSSSWVRANAAQASAPTIFCATRATSSRSSKRRRRTKTGRRRAAGQGLRRDPRPQFAYATNGHEIIEFDYSTGLERELAAFPTPADLWFRLAPRQKPH